MTDVDNYLFTAGGVIQGDHVGVLIVLLDKIQVLSNAGIVLEPILPHLHQMNQMLSLA